MNFREGDRVLTASAEFAANFIAFLQVAKRTGASVEVIPNDAAGALDPAALEAMVDDRVIRTLVSSGAIDCGLTRSPAG